MSYDKQHLTVSEHNLSSEFEENLHFPAWQQASSATSSKSQLSFLYIQPNKFTFVVNN